MSEPEFAWLAYRWRDGHERVVRIGSPDATPILILAPLFEEANRTRHFVIETMRALGRHGFCTYLPDLPGTLESLVPLESVTWSDWQTALHTVAELIGSPAHVVSLRGGALLDGMIEATSRWRLAPTTGEALGRELIRTRMAADREDGVMTNAASLRELAQYTPFDVAGYSLNPKLFAGMEEAVPMSQPPVRTIRLDSDPFPADAKASASPLWRRSEPSHDCVLSQYITSDIISWISACAEG